jgi:hypothetical protein
VREKIIQVSGSTVTIMEKRMKVGRRYHFTWSGAKCYAIKTEEGKVQIWEEFLKVETDKHGS